MPSIESIMGRISARGGERSPTDFFPDRESKKSKLAVDEFTLPTSVEESLSNRQKQMLDELVGATHKIANLYAVQESVDFYPEGLTQHELFGAAKTKPELLSPYTYVRRDSAGELIAVPIQDVFKEEIKKHDIAKKLNEAAKLASKGKEAALNLYLRGRSNAFEKGEWEKSESLWLPMGADSKIMIVIGPYDNYLDPWKLKFAWEAWVGILDEESTKEAKEFVDDFLNNWNLETDQLLPNVSVRVDHTRIMAGQAAKYEWTGNSLPCQSELRQEFGSVFTIFKPRLKDNFIEKVLPTFRSLIDAQKNVSVSDELVEQINFKKYLGHETAHSLVSPDLVKRLHGSSSWVKELYCDLLSLKGIFSLTDSAQEKETAFALAFVSGSMEYNNFRDNTSRPEYFVANSILLSFCLENGSVKISNGKLSWDNPNEVIDSILKLFEWVDYIQKQGNRVDSHGLHQQYFKEDVLAPIKTNLKPPDYLLQPPTS